MNLRKLGKTNRMVSEIGLAAGHPLGGTPSMKPRP